ncbi:asparaginase [Rhizobium sp. CG5]|uniref:asparaginase n=1 Tax=Rhizobium sp. CG5 TaxID=2726076 RepID=UPI002033FFBC|nr:asparaginase [Rhizobium sp. CG5]MCM2477232.1 asparaginase [Rhizobium sp. CG5]
MSSSAAHLTDRIVVFALGGTIAMVPGDKPGAVPTLDAADLVRAVPGLSDFDIEAVSFRQKPGAHLTFDDLEALASAIEDAEAKGGAKGVVITQGTDTIEEVAFALDLLLDVSIPVVVTGAMRNPSVASADGPANMLAAARVASSPKAAGHGVLVVFTDQIHAARFVKKQHTSSVAAFSSPNAGPVGWVSEEDVIIVASVPSGGHIARLPEALPAKVALVSLTLDFDCQILDFDRNGGVQGLVIEGLGGGHSNPETAEKLGQIADTIPVFLSSRTGSGQVLRSTYGFIGSEMDLLGRGLHDTGWLDGPKSRILMNLALRHGLDRQSICNLLSRYRA